MQLVSGSVGFNACQISLLCMAQLLLSHPMNFSAHPRKKKNKNFKFTLQNFSIPVPYRMGVTRGGGHVPQEAFPREGGGDMLSNVPPPRFWGIKDYSLKLRTFLLFFWGASLLVP